MSEADMVFSGKEDLSQIVWFKDSNLGDLMTPVINGLYNENMSYENFIME